MAIAVSSGKSEKPKLITVYGGDGLGKTTFAASAPDAMVVDIEKGSDELNVARATGFETFNEVVDYIDSVAKKHDGIKTLVVDSLTKIEPMIWAMFEDPGYGRGPDIALTHWRKFTAACDRVRAAGLNVICIAHAWPAAANDPTVLVPYDKMGLRLEKKAAAFIREWCYGVFYISKETLVVKDQKGDKKGKAVDSDDQTRTISTIGRPAFDAKSRYDLPSQMTLPQTDGFEALFQAKVDVDAELTKLIPTIKDEELKAKMLEAQQSKKFEPRKLLKRVQDQIESER